MSLISVSNVVLGPAQQHISEPIVLEIKFDVLGQMQAPMMWKLIFVAHPIDESKDQILDQVDMGPLEPGSLAFQLKSNPPNYNLLASREDVFGSTALILTASYRNQEFFRVGWFVYTNYIEPELLENEPENILYDRLYRNITVDNPRITRFNIDWTSDVYILQPMTNQTFMFNQFNQQFNPQ